MSRYDLPEYFAEIDDMPLTPGGKVLKRELLALIDTGRLEPELLRRLNLKRELSNSGCFPFAVYGMIVLQHPHAACA